LGGLKELWFNGALHKTIAFVMLYIF